MKKITVVVLFALVACGGPAAQTGATGGGSSGAGGGSAGGGAGGGGGQGGGSSGTSTCVSATVALCNAALGCGTATKLVVKSQIGTAEHMSLSDCTNYYQFIVCPSAEGDAGARDWAGCQQAITAGTCTASAAGQAIPLPTVCAGLTL